MSNEIERLRTLVGGMTRSDDSTWDVLYSHNELDGEEPADVDCIAGGELVKIARVVRHRDAEAIAALHDVAPELLAVVEAARVVLRGGHCFPADRAGDRHIEEATECLDVLDEKLREVLPA